MNKLISEILERQWTSAMLLLTALFFMALCVYAFIGGIIGEAMGELSRPALLWGGVVQNIMVFALPAIAVAALQGKKPLRRLGISISPGVRPEIMAIILYLAMTAPINWLIYYNSSISLPESMAALENTLRELENAAAEATSIMLSDTSVWGLISGILCVGIITGICEELFFRGAIQGTMTRGGVGIHTAVWISAAVFSLLHFQFYGFIPRLALGALFGYLYAWNGSLWLPATLHAINNSIVVITTWLSAHGYDISAFAGAGTPSEPGFPWITLLSAVILAVMMLFGKKLFGTTHITLERT